MQITFSRHRITQAVLFLGIIFIFSSVSFVAANAAFWFNDQIFQGVVVDNLSLGGLSQTAAEEKIAAEFHNNLSHGAIIVTTASQSFTIKPQDIDLTVDAGKTAQAAYNVGRKGNLLTQLKERYLTVDAGRTIELSTYYNHDKLVNLVQSFAQAVDVQEKNAAVVAQGANVIIVPETVGKKTSVEKTVAAIEAELRFHTTFRTPLAVDEVTPAILKNDLVGIDSILASYTTQFSSYTANRNENIMIAAGRIDGTLVKPGETFSFNQTVGSRLAEFGYKEAPVFIDGKLVPDIGGGVCQVSSTLYNAVLLADMDIVERTSHFSPPGYVPLGQDATVADGQLDFQFKNTSSAPIYIASEVSGNQLTVTIYGEQNINAPDIEIIATDKKVIDPTVVVKQNPDLDLGKEIIEDPGQKGYQITTYRIKKQNGQEISREWLATDDFPAQDRLIQIGTKSAGTLKK